MCSFTPKATLIGIDLYLFEQHPNYGDFVLKYNCPAYQKNNKEKENDRTSKSEMEQKVGTRPTRDTDSHDRHNWCSRVGLMASSLQLKGVRKMEITTETILIGGPCTLFFLAIGLDSLLEYVDEKLKKKEKENE